MGVFVESSRQRDWGCKLKAKERSGTKLTKWHQVDKVDKVDKVAPSWHKSWQSGTGWHKNWLLEWHQVDTTLTLGKLKAVDQIRKQRLIWDGLTQSKVNINCSKNWCYEGWRHLNYKTCKIVPFVGDPFAFCETYCKNKSGFWWT